MSDNLNQDIRHFDSPVFGPVRDATNDEKKDIEALADVCPHALFAALNKRLNKRGLLISIDALGG